jgi:hypothetical protein
MKENQHTENISHIESQNGARLESEMFTELHFFNKAVRKFLGRAHGSPKDVTYINKRLTELEARRVALVDSIEEKVVSDVQTRKSRQALSFRLRLFSFMHKVFMGADTVVGNVYKKRFNSSANNNANMHYIMDIQYITWAMLREPGLDVLKQVRQVMQEVYQDPRPEGNGEVEAQIRGYEQGIVGHAGVHALYTENGYYLSAPPEPVLDAHYGVDLLAIEQENFLAEVKRLGLPESEKERLITNVGSYKEANGGGWFQAVAQYPSLAEHVTLIQVKTHRGSKYKGSNVRVNGGYLNDTIRVTNDMVHGIRVKDLLKESQSLTIEGVKGTADEEGKKLIIPSGTIFDATTDLIKMANILPGAHLHFIDIELNSAHRMIARRA